MIFRMDITLRESGEFSVIRLNSLKIDILILVMMIQEFLEFLVSGIKCSKFQKGSVIRYQDPFSIRQQIMVGSTISIIIIFSILPLNKYYSY